MAEHEIHTIRRDREGRTDWMQGGASIWNSAGQSHRAEDGRPAVGEDEGCVNSCNQEVCGRTRCALLQEEAAF
jgi:hypothetical protein